MQILHRFADVVIDFALPKRCPACGEIVEQANSLCAACWQSLDFLTGQGCAHCNTPMELPGLTCGPCLAHPPHHDAVLAAVRYGETARSIAIRFKHGRRIGLARIMAQMMAHNFDRNSQPLIVPIPLHRSRLWQRGFNQSVLIARALPNVDQEHIKVNLLIRSKKTPMLKGMGHKARSDTLKGAFAINPEFKDSVKGRPVLLVDDVYTTGATANAAAKLLKRGGASRVDVLCWARVLNNADLY
jgi:ComF family protein